MYKLTLNSNTIIRLSDNACIPNDPANNDCAEYLKWVAEGNTPLPVDPLTSDQLIKSLTDKVQSFMDKEAQKLGYDNIISACSYAAGTTANKYKSDGMSFLNWRSNVWDFCYALLADVQAGTTPMPTEAELILMLPTRI